MDRQQMHVGHCLGRWLLGLLLLAGIAVGGATGEELRIVIPPELETVEGDTAMCQTAASCVGLGYRQQIVYPAAEFGSLSPANGVIIGMNYRPDHAAGPRSGELEDYLLRLSTTDIGPGELSTRFADNVGDDVVTVFDGQSVFATQAIGPSGGPHEFDYYVPFRTPFPYDPSSGRNLLVDTKSVSGSSFVTMVDAFTSHPIRQVFKLNAPHATFGDEYSPVPVVQFVFASTSMLGDFDGDGQYSTTDIDLLTQAILGGPTIPAFDLNGDGIIGAEDRRIWVTEVRGTWFGDSNLDGEFNSTDLVLVLGAGQYEDGVAANATWVTGDWDGDGEFSSSDLMMSLQEGGYEQGPRNTLNTVPEPASFWLLVTTILCLLTRRRYCDSICSAVERFGC